MSISANVMSTEIAPELNNTKVSDPTQDSMLVCSASDKLLSQNIPDSPPTMFISANSSPGCNIVNERDDSLSSLSNFYSIFTKISEEMKNKDIIPTGCFPNGESASGNFGVGSVFPPYNPISGTQLLPPSLVNNTQTGSSNGLNSFGMDEGLKPKLDFSSGQFPFSGSPLEFNMLNAYYQQMALYSQMVMAMYSPIMAGGYGMLGAPPGSPNHFMSPSYAGWPANSGVNPGSSSGSGPTAYSLFDLQNKASQASNMVSLASLSQLPCSGAALNTNLSPTSNIIIGQGTHANVQSMNHAGVSNGHISAGSSPIHSSQSIPSSMLSPIHTSQSSNPRSSLSSFSGGYEISKSLGDWASKICLRQDSRKSEKTRKSIKSTIGGRRKIDKSSAICIVCGTTQTSQWRFLNLGEIHTSTKDESPPSLKQEADNVLSSSSSQVSSTPEAKSSSATPPSTYVDKQICCNACYMKYDRNRPRYRNGKKVPPPLPPYLYSQNQYTATTKQSGVDEHSSYKQEAPYIQSEC
ncbi:hypothetical protein OJ252_2836 [Cryptosporidium canis]|uniref:GATA-type domain-containing protein n=1 Tax=Cryptosporidium canis TaxID=195482 RepID=A0ABQ8P426_9CRYT|nr:hypothetical protein OJ252_2836 [Cryptosporidium canis]